MIAAFVGGLRTTDGNHDPSPYFLGHRRPSKLYPFSWRLRNKSNKSFKSRPNLPLYLPKKQTIYPLVSRLNLLVNLIYLSTSIPESTESEYVARAAATPFAFLKKTTEPSSSTNFDRPWYSIQQKVRRKETNYLAFFEDAIYFSPASWMALEIEAVFIGHLSQSVRSFPSVEPC